MEEVILFFLNLLIRIENRCEDLSLAFVQAVCYENLTLPSTSGKSGCKKSGLLSICDDICSKFRFDLAIYPSQIIVNQPISKVSFDL